MLTQQQILEKISLPQRDYGGNNLDIEALASLLFDLQGEKTMVEWCNTCQKWMYVTHKCVTEEKKEEKKCLCKHHEFMHSNTSCPYIGAEKEEKCPIKEGNSICTNGKDTYHQWNMRESGTCTYCKPYIGAGGGKLIEPQSEKVNWYITGRGLVVALHRNNKTIARKDFLGAYDTEKEAIKVRDEIKVRYGAGKLVEEEKSLPFKEGVDFIQTDFNSDTHDRETFEKKKWYITGQGMVMQMHDSNKSKKRKEFLGAYDTKLDAIRARDRIKSNYGDK